MKFTSFDPKVTYSSSSGDSSNPYQEPNNNNNYNHNQNQRKGSYPLGNHKQSSGAPPGRRHRSPDSLPTPDYDEEEVEQAYGRTRYQKNTSSHSSSSKPIISKSTGKLMSKTNHPLKESTNNRNSHPQPNPRIHTQSHYGPMNSNRTITGCQSLNQRPI